MGASPIASCPCSRRFPSPREPARGPRRFSARHRRSSRGCSCRSWSSSATAERLPIRIYTIEDGLAHARVRRIVRDPRGFLWFCTIDGLSRFDGAEFVTYRTADGLPDPWVTDLLTTRDGAYWVATNGGVARFDAHSARRTRRPAPGGGTPSTVIQPRGIRGVANTHVRLASCWKIAPVVSGRAVGVGSPCWTEAVRRSRSDPSSRALQRLVTSLVEGVRRRPVDWDPGRPVPSPASGDVLPEPTAARAGVRHVRALGPGQRRPALGRS